jgi:thiol-disulfide isomerase/thioredoxin
MIRRGRLLSPLGIAALAFVLLLQTGVSAGQIRRFDPPVKAPSFSLPALDGGRRTLEDYRGRPLLISVWASWCAPCRYELPEFQRARDVLAEPHPDAAFITVNLGDGGARAGAMMRKLGLDLPVLLSGDKFVRQYGIISIPSILVFDPDGRLAVVHDGWVMGTNLAHELAEDLEAMGGRTAD